MAFFDDLKDKATDLGRAGMAKSKQLMEITKLSLNNSGEEDAIRKAYLEIGKLYYAERGGAPEPGYAALCQRITTAKINIEENKARIAQIKKQPLRLPATIPRNKITKALRRFGGGLFLCPVTGL